MENILELQQVSKTFSKSKFSLEHVSFNLPYGAIMGFVGENGAGKNWCCLRRQQFSCQLDNKTISKDYGRLLYTMG